MIPNPFRVLMKNSIRNVGREEISVSWQMVYYRYIVVLMGPGLGGGGGKPCLYFGKRRRVGHVKSIWWAEYSLLSRIEHMILG